MDKAAVEAQVDQFCRVLEAAGLDFIIAIQPRNNPQDCAMSFSGALTNVIGMCEVMKVTIFRTLAPIKPVGTHN